MILRYMDKLFSLQPRATTVEYGVICAVIGTAVFAALLALADPIAGTIQPTITGGVGVNSTAALRSN